MSPEGLLSILRNPYLLAFLASAAACWISIRIYPVIIMLAQKKNLMDEPGARSAHEFQVPSYGGAGIFIAFSVLTMTLACLGNFGPGQLGQILGLMAALCILFFLGVKDDMIGLDPKKKFIGQLLAAGIVILIAGVRIESLEGIFGIGKLPYVASVAFTLFVFLLVVNAYNLIDGIDGLAGAIALIASVVFGGFFLVSGDFSMATVSFVLVGALLGFLKFNLSYANRLFMGDSGSLFLGFLLAFQAVVFLNLNQSGSPNTILSNAPVIVLSVLSFPLMDTLRVFILRVREGRSPFSPDRKHLHHRLLAKGLDHKQATALIALKTLLILAVCWVLQDIPINLHLALMVALGSAVYLVPLLVKTAREKQSLNKQKALETEYEAKKRRRDTGVVRTAGEAEVRTKGFRETAKAGN